VVRFLKGARPSKEHAMSLLIIIIILILLFGGGGIGYRSYGPMGGGIGLGGILVIILILYLLGVFR
jgi:hypothetical protein